MSNAKTAAATSAASKKKSKSAAPDGSLESVSKTLPLYRADDVEFHTWCIDAAADDAKAIPQLRDCGGDGHCGYHCLAWHAFNDQTLYWLLRGWVADVLRDDKLLSLFLQHHDIKLDIDQWRKQHILSAGLPANLQWKDFCNAVHC